MEEVLRDQYAAQGLAQDFDPAVMLPGADASSKASIMDTFPLVFCLRWLTLRNEVAHPPLVLLHAARQHRPLLGPSEAEHPVFALPFVYLP